MSAGKEMLNWLLKELSDMEDISYREMIGDYLLYYRGRLFGGIYGSRLLLKKTPYTERCMNDAEHITPNPSAGEMIAYDSLDDTEQLMQIIEFMYDELPEPKRTRKSPELQTRMKK